MGQDYFQSPLEITKENLNDKAIRNAIAFAFGRQYVDKRRSRWQQESKRYKSLIRWLSRQRQKHVKLVKAAEELAHVPLRNHFSDYLYEFYAPFFFKTFPNGRIVFFPFDRHAARHIDSTLYSVSRRYKVSFEPLFGQSQGMALDFLDTVGVTGLRLPLIPRFPFLQGYDTYTENGVFYFLIDTPINILHSDNISLREKLFFDTGGFFSDHRAEPFHSDHSAWLGRPLDSVQQLDYLRWYVSTMNNLVDFVSAIQDPKVITLTSFTIGRICLDTHLLQIIDNPYLRKSLFFNLLDKYANLVVFTRYGNNATQSMEFDVWNRLLSYIEFGSRLKPILKNTPQYLELIPQSEYFLKDMIRFMLWSKYGKMVKPKSRLAEAMMYLRNYRNSLHGYLLNTEAKRESFLTHNGEIPNYLPDYSFVLWHALITDPEKFVDNLS